jgi:hypothetical protein
MSPRRLAELRRLMLVLVDCNLPTFEDDVDPAEAEEKHRKFVKEWRANLDRAAVENDIEGCVRRFIGAAFFFFRCGKKIEKK